MPIVGMGTVTVPGRYTARRRGGMQCGAVGFDAKWATSSRSLIGSSGRRETCPVLTALLWLEGPARPGLPTERPSVFNRVAAPQPPFLCIASEQLLIVALPTIRQRH